MTLYEKYAEALDAKNIDMLAALCHPNFEMVMHSSGSVASKNEYLGLFRDLCGWTGFRSCAAPTRCCGVG